jgi:two-component system chemotaxis response regulator CheB
MNKIKVLSVDDSALIRKLMKDRLNAQKGIEVIATAPDPFIAAEKIKNLAPDVVTLDIEMPKMDGITFLGKLMKIKPLPVIMVSSLTEKGADKTLEAIQKGAFDFILKPDPTSDSNTLDTFIQELAEKIRAAGKDTLKKKRLDGVKKPASIPVQKGDQDCTIDLIAIGASTGGTEVIARILSSMPVNVPGIVITQHMPPKFTKAFAERIDSMSLIKVKEAEDGEYVKRSTAYIAPGGYQMYVKKKNNHFVLSVTEDAPYNRHRPSVDLLFLSISDIMPANLHVAILTGMGADGAEGINVLGEKGAHTIAQDEESSVIFGMPKEAILRGHIDHVYNVEQIVNYFNNIYKD